MRLCIHPRTRTRSGSSQFAPEGGNQDGATDEAEHQAAVQPKLLQGQWNVKEWHPRKTSQRSQKSQGASIPRRLDRSLSLRAGWQRTRRFYEMFGVLPGVPPSPGYARSHDLASRSDFSHAPPHHQRTPR